MDTAKGILAEGFERDRERIITRAGMKDAIHDQALITHPKRGQFGRRARRLEESRPFRPGDRG
ncbi:MAG TPA: hypothetical protein VK955_17060, partial [Xanthobacteraceae bacterium]|nr:hypothetical protein [Xanthobacteraceae bacterium]